MLPNVNVERDIRFNIILSTKDILKTLHSVIEYGFHSNREVSIHTLKLGYVFMFKKLEE